MTEKFDNKGLGIEGDEKSMEQGPGLVDDSKRRGGRYDAGGNEGDIQSAPEPGGSTGDLDRGHVNHLREKERKLLLYLLLEAHGRSGAAVEAETILRQVAPLVRTHSYIPL